MDSPSDISKPLLAKTSHIPTKSIPFNLGDTHSSTSFTTMDLRNSTVTTLSSNPIRREEAITSTILRTICVGSGFSCLEPVIAGDMIGQIVQVVTIVTIIGSQVDGGSNPSATPKVLSANDNAPSDVPNIPDADTTSVSRGSTSTDLSPDEVAEHTNLGLSSTTREILVTSTKPPQPATSEVVIITSTKPPQQGQTTSEVVIITSTKPPQPNRTATSEVVIITSTKPPQLGQTTGEVVIITSIKPPQPDQTATGEVVIITSTIVVPISQSPVQTLQSTV
ncbi:hypothetical protein K435DRAFT_801406 [Dendrothele bispora CBS 962.96]|uniref:Uncharacterized protein n=1 Tax=Dendrothele bispora (strain CBS 962.96) TaxID=1314807 RepID=A0A4S8LPK8_DENBC|nr:hypothetical protein K435DRAFT_801406 [Dendrothele bispora CBS 962.96]